jgi:hypothetical protein
VPTGDSIGLADLRLLDLGRVRSTQSDVLSLVRFPDFRRKVPARAAAPAGTGFPDVRQVLGRQATVDTDGDGGGVLSFGWLPSVALSFVLLSSLLLVGALLPAGVVARTPVSPARFARIRQPLAVAAVAILIPLAIASLAAAVT